MKVFIDSYGCTFNKSDAQIMAGVLDENDIELVDSVEESDVIIVNTCYVKLPTENKIVYKIQKLQQDFPDKKVIVSGCMVEIDPEKLDKIGPNCSWIGPHQLNKTADVVRKTYDGEISRQSGFSKESKVNVRKITDSPLIHIVQICEGCIGACTFCCTRFARGPINSYPIEDIVRDVEKAVENGAKEIQLTAQDTGAFGFDTDEKLHDLINQVASIEGDFKIRVGMMHPKNIMNDVDEIVEAISNDKVYNFVHLPIQSGSDKVLNEMNRNHTVEQYYEIVNKFKERIPDITIATDIIVGYPTETDKDFELTCKLLEEVRPSLIHLSKYQHRKGAVSSSLEEIPKSVMKERSKHFSKIKTEITQRENEQLLGTVQEAIVVEKGSKGGYIAKSNSYIPIIVDDVKLGDVVKVKINETTATYLKGEVLN